MLVRRLVLTLAIGAGCDGISSDPGQTLDASPDAAPDAASAREVIEQEPNNERVQATQLPNGGGEFLIRGTCADSIDNDYYDANTGIGGSYTVRLEWQAGNYEMMFDPEDGFSGGQTQSFSSPIVASGQVIAGKPQFNIDCYNTGNPSGLTGLAYTVHLTLPE